VDVSLDSETRWNALVDEGVAARKDHDGAAWKLGELALEVETHYGEHDLERYAEQIGVAYRTLLDYRRVAKAFSERSEKLTWTHHQIVAAHPKRQKLLRQAEAAHWSVRELRSTVRSGNGTEPHDPAAKNDRCCRPNLDDAPPTAAVSVLRKDLKRAVEAAARFIPRQPRSFLLRTEGSRLAVIGEDELANTVAFKQYLDAKVQSSLEVAVPARLFKDLVASWPDSRLDLSVDGRQLIADSGARKSSINTSDSTELAFHPAELRAALEHALTSVRDPSNCKDGRLILTGVHIRTRATKDSGVYAARFICCDGSRLSVAKMTATGPGLDVTIPRLDATIPGKAARNLIDLLEHVKQDVTLAIGTARAYFKLPSATVYFLPIAAGYPNYEQLVPQKWTTRGTVRAQKFLEVINSAAVFAREDGGIVRLRFEPSAGKLVISAHSEEMGECRSEMDVAVEGEAVKIAFKWYYSADIVKGVKGDLTFELTKNHMPALFRLDNGFLHVVMPMFVQW
jgi:DNA polymerase-3 subunit beta